MRGWLISIVIFLQAAQTPASRAQSAAVTDADVAGLIEQLVTIIKLRYRGFAEISGRGSIRIIDTGEVVRGRWSYVGTLLSRSGGKILFKTVDGMRFAVNEKDVRQLDEPGHFRGEQVHNHTHGGRTALATLALLSAGVSRYDPTVRAALEYLKRHPMPGTYGRALRASIYSLMVQQAPNEEAKAAAERLMKRDASWLLMAANEQGGYDYTTHADQAHRRSRWTDNSNSQFGNLGVWIAALAGYKVPAGYWRRVDRYWSEQQHESGGWGYQPGKAPSQNMTIAGINSLVIVLDQLYAKTSGRYVAFEGIPPGHSAQEDIERVQAAIRRGMKWLAINGQPYGEPYTQLGIERLGLASGYKYIGDRDWFRLGAEGARSLPRWDLDSIEDISMWLTFLAYGSAPVLFNKLQWGEDQLSGWDYYYRDLYHVCRFISNTYERLYKWQIIDTQASLYDLKDAPFLFIAGDAALRLPEDFLSKVKTFVYGGGTIIGHANHASPQFLQSFERTFEKLFSDMGTHFRPLPPEHPLYHSAFGSGETAFDLRVPVWALSDGYREVVLLFPVDIAGAWHQSLDEKFVDFFRLMANIRFYAAPRYEWLPGRLRRERLGGPAARPWGTLRVARVKTAADRGGAPRVWDTMGELMKHFYGLSLEIDRSVALVDVGGRMDFDIAHIAGQEAQGFTDEELTAIREFARSGGLVLIEALGGDREFAAVTKQQLTAAFGEQFAPLHAEDPILTGAVPQGKPLRKLEYTHAARRLRSAARQPPLFAVTENGRTQVLFSPLDLSVSASGYHVFGLRGYSPSSSRKILRNILLYQVQQKLAAKSK